VAKYQPAKLAAMEALWETQRGAPQTLFLLPDERNERNYFGFIRVPYALSLLAYHRADAEVKGLKEWPQVERPPVLLSFFSFRIMLALGFLFPVIAALGLVFSLRESSWAKRPVIKPLLAVLEKYPRWLWVLVLAVPLPYLAIECGWCLAEVGRQPWIIYGLMKTSEGVSPIARSQVAISLVGFLVLYSVLGAVDFHLLAVVARKGPPAEAQAAEKIA
jgi:cytochrome bd ubiquinol oxidase subunit I